MTIAAGDAFDPMAGVTAADDTDGDLTDTVQVIGSFDTATPGVHVLTYVVEDSNGNQATATRAITVTEVSDGEQTGGQADGNDNADQDPSSGRTTGGNDTTGSATDGADTSGDGATTGAATDTDNRDGFLANTGANGTMLLLLGGLLSVGAGLTVWSVSRRRSTMN